MKYVRVYKMMTFCLVRDSPTVETLQTDRSIMVEGFNSPEKALGQDGDPSLTLARRCIIGFLVVLKNVNIPVHIKNKY